MRQLRVAATLSLMALLHVRVSHASRTVLKYAGPRFPPAPCT